MDGWIEWISPRAGRPQPTTEHPNTATEPPGPIPPNQQQLTPTHPTTPPKPQAVKKTRGALYETLRGKDAAIAELGGAVKRLQLAQRCGVGVEEVVTITVEVPEGAVARVIGKGGGNLKKIEEVRA